MQRFESERVLSLLEEKIYMIMQDDFRFIFIATPVRLAF